MKKIWTLLLSSTFLFGCASSENRKENIKITTASQIEWGKLNPARGDKSPKAATLWGDRNAEVETGFLVKFVDGFSSPPHIHNVTYRGIVIDGLVHNDDPKAANMWMPQTSYWTQPAGESHITSAKGDSNIAIIEIDKGPYLVKPIGEAFDEGERPYNIQASNIIWLEEDDFKVAYLWKDKMGIPSGALVKFSGSEDIELEDARVVVIQGSVSVQNQVLDPGSLMTVKKEDEIDLNCLSQEECVLYVKSKNIDF